MKPLFQGSSLKRRQEFLEQVNYQLDHVDFEVEFLESGALYKFKWAFTSAK